MIPTARDDAPQGPRDPRAPGFDVVIPMKPLDRAKSRLVGLGDDVRRDLALAFLLDVLDAVRVAPGVRGIVVVTADHRVSGIVRADLGDRVRLVPDSEPMELNRALHRGVAALRSGEGSGGGAGAPAGVGRVLALCADLPALTAAAVTGLLAVAPGAGSGFVADHTGVGTTAYLAEVSCFDPRFGTGSRAAHADQGAVDLTALARPELRADVDTPEDLWALLDAGAGAGREGEALGTGRATRETLSRHRLDRPVTRNERDLA